MGARGILLAGLTVAFTVLPATTTFAGALGPGREDIGAHFVPAGVNIDVVRGDWGADPPSSWTDPPPVEILPFTPRLCDAPGEQCLRPAETPPPAEPGAPTISDVATFPVTVGTAHNQPTGWGVVGRPTNFWAEGGIHEVSGTLLGQPATVRFTPIAWHWDYGDGTTESFDRAGKPWTEETRFRPTVTSHVYDEKADYTVTLLIDYVAEYRYAGGPWQSVEGVLRVRANDLGIITWRVKTVLVAYDCIQDPEGLGCPGTLER